MLLIKVDPRRNDHVETIYYSKGTGEIFSSDKEINNDLNIKLNLNCTTQYLPQNRVAVLKRVRQELTKMNNGNTWSRASIQAMLNFYETPDDERCKQEYAGIVIWYLRKRLEQIH